MSEGPSREEVLGVIDQSVAALLAGAGVTGPPVDALALAARLGVKVERGQRAGGGKQKSAQQQQRPEPRAEQQQWSAAHNLGEHCKADLLARLDIDPEQARGLGGGGGSLVNLFADRLLVPTPWLAAEAAACGHDLLALKELFRTASHEAIAWRLLDLDEPCVITILDNDHVYRRKSNAWRVGRELSAPEKKCQQQVSRYSRPHALSEAGWRVQGWPVHEVDWRRELLRSVLEEEAREATS